MSVSGWGGTSRTSRKAVEAEFIGGSSRICPGVEVAEAGGFERVLAFRTMETKNTRCACQCWDLYANG